MCFMLKTHYISFIGVKGPLFKAYIAYEGCSEVKHVKNTYSFAEKYDLYLFWTQGQTIAFHTSTQLLGLNATEKK